MIRRRGALRAPPVVFRHYPEASRERADRATAAAEDFVAAWEEPDEDALADAARRLGFGADYTLLGTPISAELAEPDDGAEYAAQVIGQGRVSVAPVHMASVAAGVASGTWRQPHIEAEDEPAAGDPLDGGTVEALSSMMRAVVTEGTGTAAEAEGAEVRGKTGTAEVDDGEHAWFIGHVDGVAFAVLVEEGGAGGAVAAPIAGDFAAGLSGGA